jgi:hypothetical protein
MAANRWATHLLLAAGLPTLPACLVSTGAGPAAEPAQSPPTASVSGSSRPLFGELRKPGEHIPLRDAPPAVAGLPPPTIPPPDVPAEPPATAEVAPPQPIPTTVVVARSPADDPPLVAALRAFLDNRPDLARKHLEALDGPNQELMLQLIPAIVGASRANLTQPSTEVGDLSRQLEAPVAALSAKAPLAIEKACFCRAVRNFARYEPLPDRHAFAPGSWAEVYVEVRNVPSIPASTPTEGDGFLTRLVCTLQVRDAAGAVVPLPDKTHKPVPTLHDDKRDFTRSPIRDYFLLFRFPVPPKPGAYTVSFEVQDPATGRAVSRTMPFRVQ